MTDNLFHIELTGNELTTLIIYLKNQFEIIASSNHVTDEGKIGKLQIITSLHNQLEQAFNDQYKGPQS